MQIEADWVLRRLAAYSFHPEEAIVHGAGSLSILAVVLVLAHHVGSLIAAWVLRIAFNDIGHPGDESHPRRRHRLPLLRRKTPVLHHDMHHQRVGGSDGLYFR